MPDAPSRANAIAVARPIPESPPVTMMALFFNLIRKRRSVLERNHEGAIYALSRTLILYQTRVPLLVPFFETTILQSS